MLLEPEPPTGEYLPFPPAGEVEQIMRVYETEEKENKISSHLFHLLVWLLGLTG